MNKHYGRLPSREKAPYMWILGPEGDPKQDTDWQFVGPFGSEFVHDPRKGEWQTYHVGASDRGELLADSRMREYSPGHKFLGNIAIADLPDGVLQTALESSLANTNIIYVYRQRFIRALVGSIPELEGVALELPRPVPVCPIDVPEGEFAVECVAQARQEARPYLDNLRAELLTPLRQQAA